MKIKRTIICLIIFIVIISFYSIVNADFNPISSMDGLKGSGVTVDSTASGKLRPLINGVIGIIQVAGTGISVIMVTMLGVKYILAAPADKADVKKQIAPLMMGGVILFASVNLVGIIAKFADTTLSGL